MLIPSDRPIVRREMRRAVRLGCQVVRERDFALVGLETLDVCPDGMLVRAASDLEVDLGDRVHVCFQATPFGTWFDTDATVVRVLHGRRDYDRGRSVALSFGALDRVKRFILRGAFRKTPPPVPRRKPGADFATTRRREIDAALAAG